LGTEKFCAWIRDSKPLLLTDTTFRDAHQSLLATRLRTYDMARVAPAVARHLSGLFSLEMWGGATFDVAMRFLHEDPWERLALLRKQIPNILFQMLLRGANAVGYTNYPDNVVRRFVNEAARTGMDIFRVFDSLNWLPGILPALEMVRESGAIAEAALCYTGNIDDPKRDRYSLAYYVKMAKDLEKGGAQILAIKDMAGLLRPFAARRLVKALRDEVGLGHRITELKRMYAVVNEMLGDIVKVTPSSKVVGDLALFMLTNDLTPQKILERGKELTFPESIIGYFAGDIGQPPGGFPAQL